MRPYSFAWGLLHWALSGKLRAFPRMLMGVNYGLWRFNDVAVVAKSEVLVALPSC
jgi:hypothetical protein